MEDDARVQIKGRVLFSSVNIVRQHNYTDMIITDFKDIRTKAYKIYHNIRHISYLKCTCPSFV